MLAAKHSRRSTSKATIMSLEAFADKDVQSEIDIRDKRIAELERRVRDWQVWYDGVVSDFAGLTTDPSDPQKLHDWEWMDDYRPAPLLMQFDMLD